MAARGLRESRWGIGIRWVGCDRGGVRSEGRLDDGLDDFVYVHVRRWRRGQDVRHWRQIQDVGRMGRWGLRARAAKSGAKEATGEVVSMSEGEVGLVGPDAT